MIQQKVFNQKVYKMYTKDNDKMQDGNRLYSFDDFFDETIQESLNGSQFFLYNGERDIDPDNTNYFEVHL